jgi:cation:H+ antiporter
MLYSILAVLAGFGLLIWGADRFVIGAAALARNLGVSTLLIGLTIVGFGTSAPEMLVSGTAALSGNPGLAVGNALGSNIANIGLILGITALVAPLTLHSQSLRREYPLLVVATLLSSSLLLDGKIDRVDGLVLLAGLALAIFAVVRIGLARAPADPLQDEFAAEIPAHMPTVKAVGWLALGLLILLAGSKLLVWGAVNIASALGVSDLVIGLTIVAIGTSLPELAASVMSVLKKEDDIAIGNVIGSNLYNLLGVLCLPGLLSPTQVNGELVNRDLPVMIALTLALPVLALLCNNRLGRKAGLLLTLSFAAYLGWIVLDATTA